MSRANVAVASATRRIPPRVHAAWTARWWEGDAALAALLGPPPSDESLDDAAARVDRRRPPGGWLDLLRPASTTLREDALVVVAGQQPVLAGGPALVAHKAATAVHLARYLEKRWCRPVLPVFLLATDDHDSREVDHVDYINGLNNRLNRYRCRIQPGNDSFHRSLWDSAELEAAVSFLAILKCIDKHNIAHEALSVVREGPCGTSFASHVGNLLCSAFDEGLRTVEAHRLTGRAGALLRRALADAGALTSVLAEGARRAEAVGLAPSFDPDDPRPLLLESRGGRRRRLAAGDGAAAGRLADEPADFSPHAALRPIVQAATLPVVAQVCGPSELLYLGQARGLHEAFDVTPPVLVPRLEATRVDATDVQPVDGSLDALDLDDAPPTVHAAEADAAARALDALARVVAADDPSLRARAERLAARTRRDVRRLLDALAWRGRTPPGRDPRLQPRGRPQDTVLAWLPDAWAEGDPAAWGRRIVELARPLDPPAHVLYLAPQGDS